MLFENISFVTEELTVQSGAYIGVTGDRISYVGSTPPENAAEFDRRINGAGKLLIPGMYNAHTHLAMSVMRGYGEGLSLHDWLYKRIFPFEAHLTADDMYWGTLLGCAEMLRFGTVGCTDMYLDPLACGAALADAGVKANLSVSFTGSGDCLSQPQYAELDKAMTRFHGLDGGRLNVDMSLHAEYTSDEALARSCADAARRLGVRMHVHVSETAAEAEQCRARHGGRSPVEYLADCGIFDVPATAAHCVALTDRDIEILRAKNVTVASCPKSNLKLTSGVCPAVKLLDRGVNVAVGTDSVTSNNNLNMLEEARFFSLLQKNHSADPAALTAAQALYAATRAGALSQGRTDCGCIAVGFRADLAMLDISAPHWLPVHDLMNNLIFSGMGSDVCMTVADGRVLYENGVWTTLDISRIVAHTDASRRRILSQL